tara:strand:+ start:169 stop:534 length:366 start_codon:yes stop_codon:yes gene_type:complete
MKDILKLTVILGVLDYIYISCIKERFSNMMFSIQGKEMSVKYLGVLLAYTFLIFITKYFVIDKNLTLFESFMLGSSIYAVYDMTNYATITDWDFNFAIIDMLWGGTLFASTNFLYNKLLIN